MLDNRWTYRQTWAHRKEEPSPESRGRMGIWLPCEAGRSLAGASGLGFREATTPGLGLTWRAQREDPRVALLPPQPACLARLCGKPARVAGGLWRAEVRRDGPNDGWGGTSWVRLCHLRGSLNAHPDPRVPRLAVRGPRSTYLLSLGVPVLTQACPAGAEK